jgi:MFS family permease
MSRSKGANPDWLSTQCVFVVGFGLGPLFLAPLSELYGRRIVYIVSMFLYFIFILPECVTDSFAVMIIFRCVPLSSRVPVHRR